MTTRTRPDPQPWSPIGKRRSELLLRIEYLTQKLERTEHRNHALELELRDWAIRLTTLQHELTRLGIDLTPLASGASGGPE